MAKEMCSLLSQTAVDKFINQRSPVLRSNSLQLRSSCHVAQSKVLLGSISRSVSTESIPGRLSRRGSRSLSQNALSERQKQESVVIERDRALVMLEEFRKSCATPLGTLLDIVNAMMAALGAGLAVESGADLYMVPAYVERLPNGAEEGCFYALDLGGTNFRVIRAELGGKDGRLLREEFEMYSIPEHLMHGENDELFDFIAGKLGDFIATEGDVPQPAGRKRELGFTFSFPVMQHSITSGTLIRWSKSFTVAGTVGKDVVQELGDAIRRQGLDFEIAALVNDAVGTLAAGRYWNPDVTLAVILGTGTNACYIERADAVPKWNGNPPASGFHVINTEWGNFRSSSIPTTFADEDLDRESVNPGDHNFEKLLSGLYLGEIVRRVVLKFVQEGGLFAGQATDRLTEMFTFTTPDISKIHADQSPTLDVAGEILSNDWGVASTTVADRKIVRSIIEIVTQRGARLAAAGIVGILKQIGRADGKVGKTGIAMDGGLYEHYTEFREFLLQAVEELLGKEAASKIVIKLTKDGSGVGALLLAASHSKYSS